MRPGSKTVLGEGDMRTIIAMALVLGAGVANAAPVPLACAGTSVHTDLTGKKIANYQDTATIEVDIVKGVLTYEDEVYRTISVEGNWVRIESAVELGGRIRIILNRVTGEVSKNVSYGRATLFTFEGTCKPAQKLF
jgi:hypothetical protein